MVERLRSAIAKAREQRAAQPEGAATRRTSPDPNVVDAAWRALRPLEVEAAQFARARVVALDPAAPEHAAFAMLRTMILKASRDHGVRRIAISSPTPHCGKTFVALNLAFSLSRSAAVRGLVMDLDLRRPAHARLLGVGDAAQIAPVLEGAAPPDAALRRFGDNLALCLNAAPHAHSAEVLSSPSAAVALDRMTTMFEPDVVIVDLPPLLSCDDVIAATGLYDAVMLVVAAGRSSAPEISTCERLIAAHSRFLGVVLNMAERGADAPYGVDAY